ncbi:response regulator [Anaerolineales bacterium HSG6]|nr:response regulator [Anaerolineales bacterium HSG6]
MNTTIIISILACVVLLTLLVAGGAVVWFLRNRDSDDGSSKSRRKKKNSAKADDDDDDDDDEYQDDEDDDDDFAEKLSTSATASTAPPKELDDLEAASDKITILVVDDNPDTRENVSRLLYFEKDMEVIGSAINGREGIEKAIELHPHIVIMDINMPDVDGITATGEMAIKAPYSQVIIMSVQTEHHYMRQAMAAGARDFQPKPFTAEELVSCIRRVYKIGIPTYQQIEAAEKYQSQMAAAQPKESESPNMGTGTPPIIAVYSAKGGIGTSTISVNLAVALQQEFGDAALVDADIQFGDILVHLNTKARRTMSDLIQDGEAELDILSDLMLPHNSGLKLLLAPPQPELADEITPEIIGQVLQGTREFFKIIVVDTTSQLNDRTLGVLEVADYILVVTSPELPGIKNAKLFLELAKQLEYDPKHIGVIINRANQPGGVKADQIETALKLKHTYRIPYDPKILRATRKGVSVVQQDPGAPSAQAILKMARDIWQKFNG